MVLPIYAYGQNVLKQKQVKKNDIIKLK